MEHEELLRRAEDLSRRCGKSGDVTGTFFLTPAEQAALRAWSAYGTDCTLLFHGGAPDCERQAGFFLPYYLEETDFDPAEHIRAVEIKAGFGEPEHRDYLGAVLGLGIRREWVGDIRIFGGTAYLFCLPSVESHILGSLDKVGRYGVKTRTVALGDVPPLERRVKTVSFTVKSVRLDAVCAGLFGLSRTEAARLIEAGLASLDYLPCERCDAPVREGAVLSLRGHGKGRLVSCGGQSRKGRLFVDGEIWQ